jgi:endoribonuclease LACTB2
MFFKKNAEQSEHSGVRMINGIIRFQAIRLNVYCYEIDGVLIDTGAAALLEQFKSFFSQMDVDQIVLTHHHEDHSGCVNFLQRNYNLPVYMSDLRREECTKKASYPLYRKLFWGTRPTFTAQVIEQQFTSRTCNWTVIETPGHTNDHLSFLNNTTGQLFTGDLFVTPKTKIVLKEESIPQIIQSIEKVLTYDFEEMYCQHAGYVIKGREGLELKREYLLELSHKIQSMSNQGLSEKEINEQLFQKNIHLSVFHPGNGILCIL